MIPLKHFFIDFKQSIIRLIQVFCSYFRHRGSILTLRRFLAHYILVEDRKEIRVKEILVLSIYFQWLIKIICIIDVF